MKKYHLVLFIMALPYLGFSQELNKNLGFYNYLINNRNYEDAILLLSTINPDNDSEIDSLNFYKGKAHYFNQNLAKASEYLDMVKKTSLPFKREAYFFNAFSKAHIKSYNPAIDLLKGLSLEDSLYIGLKQVELAGVYLLKRDLNSFDEVAKSFNQQYYQFSAEEKSFISIRKDLGEYKKKSPFLAGLMSAIVPGSGRIYAGKTGLGIGTFLTTAVLGLQTWEGYRKDGIESARFIIFGSIFSVLYVGNIWGSVFTVKMVNNEFNDAVDRQILIDLHIPLRNVFN